MERIKGLKPFVKIYGILIAVFFLSMALVYCIPASWLQDNIDRGRAAHVCLLPAQRHCGQPYGYADV